ncbi:MAG: hypothetical protein WDN25_28820 [Acetobacteraceae bacterium]
MSQSIRLSAITDADVAAARQRMPRAFAAPWQQRVLRAVLVVAVLGWLGYLHWLFEFGKIFSGLERLGVIVG